MKAYRLEIPDKVYNMLQIKASKSNMSVEEYTEFVMKFGISCFNIVNDPTTKLLIEKDGTTKEVIR